MRRNANIKQMPITTKGLLPVTENRQLWENDSWPTHAPPMCHDLEIWCNFIQHLFLKRDKKLPKLLGKWIIQMKHGHGSTLHQMSACITN